MASNFARFPLLFQTLGIITRATTL
ncbi:rCG25860, partial [Rattus norvegicus]